MIITLEYVVSLHCFLHKHAILQASNRLFSPHAKV